MTLSILFILNYMTSVLHAWMSERKDHLHKTLNTQHLLHYQQLPQAMFTQWFAATKQPFNFNDRFPMCAFLFYFIILFYFFSSESFSSSTLHL